ncbi:MAG: hypothetical protein QOE01_3462, partial [Actinomycetota bacterium]|nr:hypothetical protein [Actinomycetota bacterium]
MEGAQHIDLTDASGLVRDALRGDEQFAVTGATGWLGRVALDVL